MIPKDLNDQWHSYLTLNYKDGHKERVRTPLWGDITATEDGNLVVTTYEGFHDPTGSLTVPINNLRSWQVKWEAQ